MLQYVKEFIDRVDTKTLDQCKDLVATKYGVVGISAAVGLATLFGYNKYTHRESSYGIPCVPYTIPFVGSNIEYRKNPVEFCKKWNRKLGPVFRTHLLGGESVVVSGPLVKEILLNENFDFILGLKTKFDVILLLGFEPGDDLKDAEFVRKIITKHLTPNLNAYTSRVVKALKDGAYAMLGNAETTELDHVYPLVQSMVAKTSAAILVGEELSEDKLLVDSFKNMVIDVGSELKPNPWLEPFGSLQRLRMWYVGKTSKNVARHKAQLHSCLKKAVERRLDHMENDPTWARPNDLLQDVLEYKECRNSNDIAGFLVRLISGLIFAAIHTTSENSSIVLYRLMQNPHLMDELLEEQNDIIAAEGLDVNSGPEVFTRDLLKKFVKLDSLCRESMRMRNDYINLPHYYKGTTPFVLSTGGVILPGEMVYLNLWANHVEGSQPGSSNSDTFDALRFVSQSKESSKVGQDFLIFGMGRHACPGRWFAIQEMQTIISMLIRTYKISAIGDVGFPIGDSSTIPWGRLKLEKRSTVA